MENKGFLSLLSSRIHFPTHPNSSFSPHLVCLKIFFTAHWKSYINLSLSSEVNEEEHLNSSGFWFPPQLLLFVLCVCVFTCACVHVLCSVLFLCASLFSLFWVSTPHRRPRISWLPACQCRPWLWPAGWCCRCGNVAPPTGPGSQRLGSLWMQRNSCVCKRREHKNSRDIVIKSNHHVHTLKSLSFAPNQHLQRAFQPRCRGATASCNSVNVTVYCVISQHPDRMCWSTK